MAWRQARGVVRDIVLLTLGTTGFLHELLASGGLGERPLMVGLIAGCLGIPLVLGTVGGKDQP